jgi:hypothetical protein
VFADGEHKHDESVTSVGIKCTGAMDPATFKAWLSELLQEKGVDIFRSKVSFVRVYCCLVACVAADVNAPTAVCAGGRLLGGCATQVRVPGRPHDVQHGGA